MPQTNAINNLIDVEASTEQVPVVGYTVLWRLHVVQYANDWCDGGPFVIDHDYSGIATHVLDTHHHHLHRF